MKILILEDEIPAYQKLQACIKEFFKDNEPSSVQSDWARTNKDGKQLLKRYINHYKSGGAGGSVDIVSRRKAQFTQITQLAQDDNLYDIVKIFKTPKVIAT